MSSISGDAPSASERQRRHDTRALSGPCSFSAAEAAFGLSAHGDSKASDVSNRLTLGDNAVHDEAPPPLPGDWRPFSSRMSLPWLRRFLFSRRARRGWTIALWLVSAIVVALALMPWSVELPSSGWDKADHVAAFAALAFLGLFAWRGRQAVHRRIVLSLLALGVAIELAQTLVPGRMADWRDVIADSVGVLLGLVVASWLARRMDRRSHERPDDVA